MGKYLKQGFVRELAWMHAREEISYSKMVELMEEECIKNYKAELQEDIFKDQEPNETLKKAVEKYKETFNTK